MKLVRIVSVALMALLFSSSVAYAQEGETVTNEEFNVEITPPAKWEATQGNDKAVANFKHTGSQSQIEVVATKLMTKNVAEVFFETFHKTLAESDFKKAAQDKTSIGDLEGTQTTYKFEHSGVTLEVVIFEFLREDTAWLVVGYMQDVEKEKYVGDFKKVIENMKFGGGD